MLSDQAIGRRLEIKRELRQVIRPMGRTHVLSDEVIEGKLAREQALWQGIQHAGTIYMLSG